MEAVSGGLPWCCIWLLIYVLASSDDLAIWKHYLRRVLSPFCHGAGVVTVGIYSSSRQEAVNQAAGYFFVFLQA